MNTTMWNKTKKLRGLLKPLVAVAAAAVFSIASVSAEVAAAAGDAAPPAAGAREVTATVGGVSIYVNRRPFLPTDANGATVAPVVVDGTTFLPVRALSEAFGKTVAWDEVSMTVTLSGEGEADGGADGDAAAAAAGMPQAAPAETAVIAVEKGVAIVVDGERLLPTDAAGNPVEPFIYQGTTYLPVRAVSSALGQEISWDGETSSVYIGRQPRRAAEDAETSGGADAAAGDKPGGTTGETAGRTTGDAPEGRTTGGARRKPADAGSDADAGTGSDAAAGTDGDADAAADTGFVIPAGAYSAIELSPDDMQLLMSEESREIIRFRFEQTIFPALVLSADDNLAADIRKKSSNASNWASDMWAANASIFIDILQQLSDDLYIHDESKLTDEKLVEGLKALIDRAGLSADGFFTTSFADTAEDGVMLLLTFGDTDGFEACKYIGVVAMPDSKLFYFTAEAVTEGTDELNLCFVNTKTHGTVGTIGSEESDFIEGVNAQLGKLREAGALAAPQEKVAPPDGGLFSDRGTPGDRT